MGEEIKKIYLVGNPNVGKTTFFNFLTQSFEHTGNWHGVTVDAKQKNVKFENAPICVVDLPGIYSTTSFSPEEQVAIDGILQFDGSVVNICDANVLQRNLYLTLSLLECGICPFVAINFSSQAQKRGCKVNFKTLSKLLGVPIFENNFNTPSEFFLVANKTFQNLHQTTTFPLPYLKDLPLTKVKNVLSKEQKSKFDANFLAIKILEQDETITKKLNLLPSQQKILNEICKTNDFPTLIAKLRYDYITQILKQCTLSKTSSAYGLCKADKIVLNKFLCLPIFFAIMLVIFFATFSSVGEWLSSFLKYILTNFVGEPIHQFLLKINAPNWIVSLFSTGIMESVAGILSFIPQVVLLFFFLSMLEDSGYISRLAFCVEDLFAKFGLSGKSVFTLLMSLGCTTTSILTTRTIEDKNSRLKTALVSPFLSCSAKLPIYAVICGAFFSKNNMFVIVSLYIFGVIVALIVSSFLNRTNLKSKQMSFILEFPPYRFPKFKRVFCVIAENCKSFVAKVFTILFSFSIIVWILQNFSFSFAFVPQNPFETSMLQTISSHLTFLFVPLGLDNWGIVASLMVGILAKEMVVGTMAIINHVPNSQNFDAQLGASLVSGSFVITLSQKSALVFLVFSLLYAPCISTMAVMKKEFGFKWALFGLFLQFCVAYVVCFALNALLSFQIVAKIVVVLGLIVALCLGFVGWKNHHKNQNPCAFCSKQCFAKHQNKN